MRELPTRMNVGPVVPYVLGRRLVRSAVHRCILTGKYVLDASVAKRSQTGDKFLVVNLIVPRLVEHAEQAIQDLRVRLHNAHEFQRFAGVDMFAAITRGIVLTGCRNPSRRRALASIT